MNTNSNNDVWALIPDDFDESIDSEPMAYSSMQSTPVELHELSTNQNFLKSSPEPNSFNETPSSDVHLSKFLHLEQVETQKSKSRTNVQTEGEFKFHPNSQIKLYNRAIGSALVIRLGHAPNGLTTIVFDICASHNGKSIDWANKVSVAMSPEEMLEAYVLFMNEADQNQRNFTLKFHKNSKSPLNIQTTATTLIVTTCIHDKNIIITGKISQKMKFLAQLETAYLAFCETAFPTINSEKLYKKTTT